VCKEFIYLFAGLRLLFQNAKGHPLCSGHSILLLLLLLLRCCRCYSNTNTWRRHQYQHVDKFAAC